MTRLTKILMIGVAAIAIVCLTGFNAKAQGAGGTSNDPIGTNGPGIVDQFKTFLTEPNTGYHTFDKKTADIWVGSCFEQNINADAIIGIDFTIYKKLALESTTRIWNSSQTIKSQGIGIGPELAFGDLKIGAFAVGGWRFDLDRAYGGAALQIKKGVGGNSYLGTRIETDFIGREQRPFIATFFGVNF
jgi:hypothetical protein